MPGGRPRTPTQLKILRGNPGHRPLPENEPLPKEGIPQRPTWLASEAKREWKRIVPELRAVGLLTLVDRAALAAYCQSWARWRAAEEAISEHGSTMEVGPTHYLQQRPEVSISQKERAIMKSFLTEFGLTPASRTRIQVAPKAPVDEFEQFVSRKA